MTTTSGILMITDPQRLNHLNTIKEKLLSQYNATTLPVPWSLNYRLLRSTGSPPGEKTLSDSQYLLQLLSQYPSRTFLAASVGHELPVIEIPFEQTESFYKLLTDKFNTLWVIRLGLQISNGASYEIGDVTVRLGELRLLGNANVRALICNIEMSHSVPIEPEANCEVAKTALTDIAESIGFTGTKDLFRSYEAGSSFDKVQLFCEALRYRA